MSVRRIKNHGKWVWQARVAVQGLRQAAIRATREEARDAESMLLDAGRYRGAVVLIYSGIDTMAWIGMDGAKEDVQRTDFVEWAGRYIKFDCQDQLTGLDLYGARCSVLHNYSMVSQLSREKKCRIIGYMDRMVPPIVYRPDVTPDMVMVSVPGLAEAFFAGLNRFLVDVFADAKRLPIAEERLENLLGAFPFGPPSTS